MKENCWEYKKCGREPGGSKAGEMGVCPSTLEKMLDGVHEGLSGGRACWVVAGTLCGGQVQGTFAGKFKNCMNCDFYARVKAQEEGRFQLTPQLLKRLE